MNKDIFATDPAELTTTRLTIRPCLMMDADAFQAIADDAMFMYVPQISTPFNAASWLTEKFAKGAPRIGHTILRSSDSAPIGYIQGEATRVTRNEAYVEIGYWIGRPFWRQGFGTEAVRRLLHYFNAPRAWPVFANVHIRNEASRRLLITCGFEPRVRGPIAGAENFMWYRWQADVPAKVGF